MLNVVQHKLAHLIAESGADVSVTAVVLQFGKKPRAHQERGPNPFILQKNHLAETVDWLGKD